MPIGLVPDAIYSSFELRLSPGDRLLLYSDGITECPVGSDTMLEEQGLAEILRQNLDVRGTELLDLLHDELKKRSGLTEFPDDLSVAQIEWRPIT